METMIDELAAAAGRDPARLPPRAARQEPARSRGAAARRRQGGLGQVARAPASRKGIAVHESFDSFVAQVAEVSMRNGKVKVERVVCAVDCGVAVNPDVIRAQMEGCIGFGLARSTTARSRSRPAARRSATSTPTGALRIHEMPKVEVHIVAEHRKADRRRRAGRAAAGAGGSQCRRQTGRAARAPPAVHAGRAGRDLTTLW